MQRVRLGHGIGDHLRSDVVLAVPGQRFHMQFLMRSMSTQSARARFVPSDWPGVRIFRSRRCTSRPWRRSSSLLALFPEAALAALDLGCGGLGALPAAKSERLPRALHRMHEEVSAASFSSRRSSRTSEIGVLAAVCQGTKMRRSLRKRSPATRCSTFSKPIGRARITMPGKVPAAPIRKASTGSPSSAAVPGTKPQSWGSTVPGASIR